VKKKEEKGKNEREEKNTMNWNPIGPGFVFIPRNSNFKRLSRRNESGTQGMVSFIAVDPADPSTIYTLERPWWGGRGAFRTRDDGESWVSIIDALVEQDPFVGPLCLAVNPAHPETIYMGSGWDDGTHRSFGIYVSHNRGDDWDRLPFNVNTNVNQILIDPRTAADLSNTTLCIGTDSGVYLSQDSGKSWTQQPVVSGLISSLKAFYPKAGAADYYAGVSGKGVFHTNKNDLTQPWLNLNDQQIGLPPSTNTVFDRILLDYCPNKPERVYAWFFTNGKSVGLFTSAAAQNNWTAAAPAGGLPDTGSWYYTFAFAVAPNSPGDGKNDILFFTPRRMGRSIDSGHTWQVEPDGLWFYEDAHAFAFSQANNQALPCFYQGCDGGLCMSTRYADPGYDITQGGDFDEGLLYTGNNGATQNYNHGKLSSAINRYTSHQLVSALGYIGCQDTGAAGGAGLCWRGFNRADVGNVAMAPGADGVKVWVDQQVPSFVFLFTDKDQLNSSDRQVLLDDGQAPVSNTYRGLAVGPDNNCIGGVFVWDRTTVLTADVQTGTNWASPASMDHIHVGTILQIDNETGIVVKAIDNNNNSFQANFSNAYQDGAVIYLQSTTSLSKDVRPGKNRLVFVGSVDELVKGTAVNIEDEGVIILDVDAQQSAFRADIVNAHKQGASVRVVEVFVARMTHDGRAAQISQNFSPADIPIVVVSPRNADLIYCVTNDNRIWTTTQGKSASKTTVWSEITGSLPRSPVITALAIDCQDNLYILLAAPVTDQNGGSTPLLKFVKNDWAPQPSSQLPKETWFGRMVADPVEPGTLYAVLESRIYLLKLVNAAWVWQDISAGLPRNGGLPKTIFVNDLWIADINPSGPPKVLLRAALLGRGVWETDVTAGAVDPPIVLYVRDNILDQGWLQESPDGVPDPFNPVSNLYHFQCADIKIDVRQSGQGKTPDFFQTDPEGSIPLSHVLFEQLKDNSRNLTATGAAHVHVQVHNRSCLPADDVRVWMIYSDSGVPLLNAGPSQNDSFDFWSQFTQTGHIVPNLPLDSPWKSLGPPVTLNGIDAANPRVASWDWIIPPAPFDPKNYCLVVFIHSATSPINETRYNVDGITPRNKQVGQLLVGNPSAAIRSGISDRYTIELTTLLELLAKLPDPDPGPVRDMLLGLASYKLSTLIQNTEGHKLQKAALNLVSTVSLQESRKIGTGLESPIRAGAGLVHGREG
jgi:hypothetical protein